VQKQLVSCLLPGALNPGLGSPDQTQVVGSRAHLPPMGQAESPHSSEQDCVASIGRRATLGRSTFQEVQDTVHHHGSEGSP
jgi:hypothetical protein